MTQTGTNRGSCKEGETNREGGVSAGHLVSTVTLVAFSLPIPRETRVSGVDVLSTLRSLSTLRQLVSPILEVDASV